MPNNDYFLPSYLTFSLNSDIPFIETQEITLTNLNLISFSDISSRTTDLVAKSKGVHFFIDDMRFECVYKNPKKYVNNLKRFRFVCSPDFSVWSDDAMPLQLCSVYKNRYCGAYWQKCGLKVIPTISWGDEATFDFCFSGIEKGATVAVSTLGCKKNKEEFMSGYREMLGVIEPEHVICFDKPFPEMDGDIHYVSYLDSRRKNHGEQINGR